MIEIGNVDLKSIIALTFYESGISPGFPSPALDFEDLKIDLNSEIIKHPNSTFYGRVRVFR